MELSKAKAMLKSRIIFIPCRKKVQNFKTTNIINRQPQFSAAGYFQNKTTQL